MDNSMSATDWIGLFLFLFALFALYCLPSIIAILRRAHTTGPVVVVNLFLGWTIIGWIVALAMSFTAVRRPVVMPSGHVMR